MLSKVKGGKRCQACKMPKVLGARPNELRQHAINLKKKNAILYYFILYKSKIYIFPIKIRSLKTQKKI
jgi:hypothetical protein